MKKLIALAAVAAFALVAQGRVVRREHAAVGSAKCKMCHKVEFDVLGDSRSTPPRSRRPSARPATATAPTT